MRNMLMMPAGCIFAAGLVLVHGGGLNQIKPGLFFQKATAGSVQNASLPRRAQQAAWDALNALASDAEQATQAGQGPFGEGATAWKSSCDVFYNCPPDTPIGTAEARTQLSRASSAHGFRVQRASPAATGSSVAGDSVFFNSAAANAIHHCTPHDTDYCIENGEFPAGSMIGRFAWYAIDSGTGSCPSLQVFDPDHDSKSRVPSGHLPVDTGNCVKPTPDNTVPLSKFFSVKISPASRPAFRSINGPLPAVAGATTVVVVGFHLIQKVKDNDQAPNSTTHWVWSTFWWSMGSNQGAGDAFTGYQCSTLNACPHNTMEWGNYVMDSIPSDVPSSMYTVISNPYVDKTGSLPLNCIVCHSYAMAPADGNGGGTDKTADGRTRNPCGGQDPTKLTAALLQSKLTGYATMTSTNPVRVPRDQVWSMVELIADMPQGPICKDLPGG